MDGRRLVVGAVVVLLAAAAGAGLAGLGPGADGGGPDDGRATETTTETDPVGTPSPATARERATPTIADAVGTPSPVTDRDRATPTTDGERTSATTVAPAGGSSGQSGPAERDPPVADPEPTATSERATTSDTVRTTSPTSTPAVETPTDPFEVRIERVEPCGQLCRDITASLTNRQATPATGVVVTTRLYPGNGTDGRPVWTGQVPVGTLGPGATETTNERVELSIFDGFAISDAGGWVTISTTIQSDERTVTVAERRQVT